MPLSTSFSQIVYKRYASLYFCCAIENTDNELLTLEIIHRYVELLDKYFGSVCELDIIFNFEKVSIESWTASIESGTKSIECIESIECRYRERDREY